MIYFDHNATTPINEHVVEAMLPYLTTFYANPSSLYRAGRITRSAIDTAREQVAALIDAQPAQIVFTSGGTEANNLALRSVQANSKIAVSAVEHPSVIDAASQYTTTNNLIFIDVSKDGLVLDCTVKALFAKTNMPDLISIMLANNENGAIQEVKKFADFTLNRKTLIHTDASQAVGKIPISFKNLGVDLMTVSSHKIYGPKGCGALVVNKPINFTPLLVGGNQEYGLRAGTENVATIVGFGKAAELRMQKLEQCTKIVSALKKTLEAELKTIPNLIIFAELSARLPNTVQFGINGINGEMLLMHLDQKNIAVSSGSACRSGSDNASLVLEAMGVDYQLAKSAIRISLGDANTKKEIAIFSKILKKFLATQNL